MNAKKQRGRPAESDRRQLQYAISGLVVQFMRAEGTSLNEARRKVAADLDTSEDTVKRACRAFPAKAQRGAATLPTESHVAALVFELQLNIEPKTYIANVRRVKTRLNAIRSARGK